MPSTLSPTRPRSAPTDRPGPLLLALFGDPRPAPSRTSAARPGKPPRPASTPRSLAEAALLATPARTAVVSHDTAARLHGLALPPGPGPEHVTVPRRYRYLRRIGLVAHTTALPPRHRTRVSGLPCTTVPRTILDLARVLPRLPAIWLVEDALRRRLVTRAELTRCLTELPRAPGDREVRARLAAADGTAGRFLQCAARVALADAGVPAFMPEYELRADGVRLGVVDGAYPDHRLALEFRESPHTSCWRWLPVGWRALAFSWRDIVHEPARLTTVIREHLAAEVHEAET